VRAAADSAPGERLGPLVVAEPEAGQRLDRFLAPLLGSRAQAAKLIEGGAVRVDGRVLPKRHIVLAGELIELDPRELTPPPPAQDPDLEFTVAWEDEHLMILDKPAGLVVHPARGHRTGTLVQALEGRVAGGEDPLRPGIVHRLDKDTSGLLVVSRSEPVHRALREQLASRRIHREYLALVDGTPPARTGTVDAPIGRDRREPLLHSVNTDAPRQARTHFQILRVLSGCSLLRVVLETGRTHQIRVHLAAIGHPVAGDRAYGGSSRFGLRRQFLHAARLALTHPVTGEDLDVRSELPPELAEALALAGEPYHREGRPRARSRS
jgi:23S rRNA pseudouridine1911/1915/1917 synthase